MKHVLYYSNESSIDDRYLVRSAISFSRGSMVASIFLLLRLVLPLPKAMKVSMHNERMYKL